MKEWKFAVDERLSEDILKMETWQAFEFVMAQFYFAGHFDGKIPVDWGRYMTEQILAKSKLLEALESCKPEDLEVPDGGEYTREAWAVYDRAVAHNEATKQYQSNIRKLFE